MESTGNLILESVAFVKRAFEALEKQSPDQCAALSRLASSDGTAVRLVVDLGGSPSVSCFLMLNGEPHYVASEALSVKPLAVH